MNLLDFYRQYPDESFCKEALRHFREHHGLFCSRCGGLCLSRNPSHRPWTCMDCKHDITLCSGTVMQGSNLPIRDWFAAMFLLTATKHAISAKEIQRQLGRKRYQPVLEMVHKLHDVMGKRDARYNHQGDVEIDEGFFSTETPEDQKDYPLNQGRGSQRKTSVLIMAESSFQDIPPDKKRSTPKIVGHIKMDAIDDLKASTETSKIKQTTGGKANVTTDNSNIYAPLEKDGMVASHKAVAMDDKKKMGKVLPWVHITISNAKRNILDTYHDIKDEFLQLYLNKFCYRFNRRYFGFKIFERLEFCACTYRAEFKHRIYLLDICGHSSFIILSITLRVYIATH